MIKLWQLFIRVLHKTKVLRFLNFTISLKLYGNKVIIPIIGHLGIYHVFMDEYWISDIFNIIKQECKICIDIGANLGQTLVKLKAIDKNVKYLGLEPNSNCLFYLEKLIQVNGYPNCTIIPAGLSYTQKMDTIHFLWNEDTDRSATVYPVADVSIIKKQICNFITWNEIPSLNKADLHLIKIDVERAESDFLGQILNSEINCIIIIEVLPLENGEKIDRFEICHEAIINFGYMIFKMNKRNEKFISLTRLKAFDMYGDLNDCDYLLLKHHHLDFFKDRIF